MKKFFVIGLNHRSAPLQLREAFTIPSRDLPEALTLLRRGCHVDEAVILSTCNRVELYGRSADPETTVRELLDFLSHKSRLDATAFQAHLYTLSDRRAVAHLFRVTAGLDSAILGESEITAQVKAAYQDAHAHGATGAVLNHVFQRALHAAKEIRSRTHIGAGQASIGSVVTALARQVFDGQLASREVLLWGAGKAAEVTARHLIKSGIRHLWIVNRTPLKAQDLALLCQSGWLSWEQAMKHLAHVDIAIVCTQAPHYVIDQDDVKAALATRHAGVAPRPAGAAGALCLIDLAVPRNVDPAVRTIPGIRLYDIDQLHTIAQTTRAQRQQELERCEGVIDQQVNHCWQRWNRSPHKEDGSCQSVEAFCSS